jgi:hypothetical protein
MTFVINSNKVHNFITGGIWINLGPLLYHFSDLPNEDSIEPSYQVVREVIVGIGFEIEVCHNVPLPYILQML